ncbi:hypothetical protein [Sulfuricella denitrificans]|nr:hypothetical protein [Sulfuricella denitrificans]
MIDQSGPQRAQLTLGFGGAIDRDEYHFGQIEIKPGIRFIGFVPMAAT